VVHGNALLLNWDQEDASALLCLDARTGQTIWKVDRDEKTSWNTPLVVTRGGRTQVIVNGTKRIRSYDLGTGKLLWSCGGMTVNPIPSAVADEARVYCMSGYTGSAAVAIPLDAQGELTRDDQVVCLQEVQSHAYRRLLARACASYPHAAYAPFVHAPKGGLLTLTRNIAGAYCRDNIRVNYLIPGWNITETEKVGQAQEGHDAAWLAQVEARQPGGRFSVPADAAHAILWLASDESIFVNGAMINTDGGAAMLPNARRG